MLSYTGFRLVQKWITFDDPKRSLRTCTLQHCTGVFSETAACTWMKIHSRRQKWGTAGTGRLTTNGSKIERTYSKKNIHLCCSRLPIPQRDVRGTTVGVFISRLRPSSTGSSRHRRASRCLYRLRPAEDSRTGLCHSISHFVRSFVGLSVTQKINVYRLCWYLVAIFFHLV